MKKTLLLAMLLLASCRSAHVAKTHVVQHDTVWQERVATTTHVARDTVVASCNQLTALEHTTLDTAGRVCTITRVIARTATNATRGTHATATMRDTTATTHATTTQSHTTTAYRPKQRNHKWVLCLVLAVIIMLIARKT